MTDQNLRMPNRRSHRGVFFIGAGVLCAVAVTLAGCSGSSKEKDPIAGISQTKLVEAERAKFAKSERARKAVVQKLAIALATNKTQDKELLDAKITAKRLRKDLQAADKDIDDLATELAKANAQRFKTEEAQSALQQSEQLVESPKTKLDKSSKERNVLKAHLDEALKDIEQLVARIETVESEKGELKYRYVRVQQQAAQLDKAVEESRAESERLNKQVQAALAKAASALDSGRIVHVLFQQSVKERAQVEQAATKEAETLRDQLATAKRQISNALAEAKQINTEISGLKDKLATANDEIARLKAVRAEKPTSSATQQPAQPQ